MANKGGGETLDNIGSFLGNAFIPETMARFRTMNEMRKQRAAISSLIDSSGIASADPTAAPGDVARPGISDQVFRNIAPNTDAAKFNTIESMRTATPAFDPAFLSSQITKMFPAPMKPESLAEGAQLVNPLNGKVIASNPKAPTQPTESEFLRNLNAFQNMNPNDPRRAMLGDWLQKNSSRADSEEPLVQIPDPNDPTKAIYVPRSQAVGKQAFQTPRDRMPKMQTYYDENGRQIQLDSNDPEDQKIIRAQGLVTAGPSDGERASLGFVNRMGKAEAVLGDITASGYQPGLRDKTAGAAGPLGNFAMSDAGQSYRQAQEDWVRAKLRKESGAVIGEDEMAREITTYFPQPGDNPKTIQQKYNSRMEAQRQLATTAGILGKPRLRELDAPIKGASGGWGPVKRVN